MKSNICIFNFKVNGHFLEQWKFISKFKHNSKTDLIFAKPHVKTLSKLVNDHFSICTTEWKCSKSVEYNCKTGKSRYC